MIEPTDEMRSAVARILKARQPRAGIAGSEIEETLAAVLALAERDRLDGPAAVRCALDQAVAAALPLAGGPLLPPLRALKRALDRFPPGATS